MQAVLTYVLALGGMAAMAFFVVGTFGGLKYPSARMMLVNLLRTNPYQAERVCSTTHGSFFEAIGAALKTGGMMGSRDPAVVVQATKPAYDAAGQQVSMKWKMIFGKAKLAGMAVGGAVILPMTQNKSIPIPILLIGIVTAAGLGWIFLYQHEVNQSIVRARAEILPEAERAIVDGRYVSAPPKAG